MEGRLNTNNPKTEDKILICCDCGSSFVFTAGEQLFFTSKGLSTPKRCKPCRKQRRDTIVPENSSRVVS